MSKNSVKSRLKAKLVNEGDQRLPCAFCQRNVDDEIVYGNLYAIGDLQCHYFCVLLSSCLVQKGKDVEGLLGFMYHDIVAEVERSKKHRCSYCGRGGATLGCSISQCRKQFHLPCGRERNAISLFMGNYKSFCQKHVPKQKIPDNIMAKANLRISAAKSTTKSKVNTNTLSNLKELSNLREFSDNQHDEASTNEETESVCVICYETVEGFPTVNTFWPPCCARDAWFHRSCLQHMALSAGMHYLKCPLCNDKENFYDAVVSQGYYVPDRDAAWELEQNAFAEIYERPISCSATECLCPMGRNHDAETGQWDIKLCLLCGSCGVHLACGDTRHICAACRPAAPQDLDALEQDIQKVIISQQPEANRSTRRGPIMPSRMSLRRTKRRSFNINPSSSTSINSLDNINKTENAVQEDQKSDLISSRLELNLKSPRKPTDFFEKQYFIDNQLSQTIQQTIDKFPIKLFETIEESPKKLLRTIIDKEMSIILQAIIDNRQSPLKLLQNATNNKIISPMKIFEVVYGKMEGRSEGIDKKILEKLRRKFRKPRPLCEKKRIVNRILKDLFDNILKENSKKMEPDKEWTSPKKQPHIVESKEQTQGDNKENTTSSTQNNTQTNTTSNDEQKATNFSVNVEIKLENTSSPSQDSVTFKIPEITPKKRHLHKIIENTGINTEKITKQTLKLQKEELIIINHSQNIVLNKFSPIDKETLQRSKVGIDIESFKNHYLNEVDRDFCCKFKHPHRKSRNSNKKLITPINFAINAIIDVENGDDLKRKLDSKDSATKKRKIDESTSKDEMRMNEENLTQELSHDETNKSNSESNITEESKISDKKLYTNISPVKLTVKEKISHNKLPLKDETSQNNLENEETQDKSLVDEEISPKIKENNNEITDERNVADINTDSNGTTNKSNVLKRKIIKNNNNTFNKHDRKLIKRINKSSSKAKTCRNVKRAKLRRAISSENNTNNNLDNCVIENNTEKEITKADNIVKSNEIDNIRDINEADVNNDKVRKKNENPSKRKIKKNSDKERYRKKRKITHEMSKIGKVKKDRKKIKINCDINSTKKDLNERNFLKFLITDENALKRHPKIKLIKFGDRKTKRILKTKKLKLKVNQCVLSPGDVTKLVKPENDATPIKRKYVKQERTSDNLKQTSIINFFKIN